MNAMNGSRMKLSGRKNYNNEACYKRLLFAVILSKS